VGYVRADHVHVRADYYESAPTEACENLRAIWDRFGLPGVPMSGRSPVEIHLTERQGEELAEILRDRLRLRDG
jgi:hypothetical protein